MSLQKEIDWRSIIIVFSVCVVAGVILDFFTSINWLVAAAFLQGTLWLAGLWASEDEPWPGDEDYPHPAESQEYRSHLKALRIHKALIFAAYLAALLIYVGLNYAN